MRQEITIRPVPANSNTSTLLTGKYIDSEKGNTVILLDNGSGRYSVIYNREPVATERMFKKWFDKNSRDLTITWDDSTDQGKLTGDFANALQRHTQIQTEGFHNPNRQGTPQFDFLDKRKQTARKVESLKEKNEVFNMVNNLPVSEMIDICFFVGHNPVNKTFEDSFVTLLDFNDGILMKNPIQFMKDWGGEDKSITVIVRKAIDLKIVTSKEGKFYVNTEIVGDSYEGVIAYMKVNDKLFDFVKRNVEEKDTLPLDVSNGSAIVSKSSPEPKGARKVHVKTDAKKADDKLKKEAAKTADHDERVILKAKMKALGIPGGQLSDAWAIEKIKEKIYNKEQENKKQPA